MPISQDRLKSICKIARHYETSLALMRKNIKNILAGIPNDPTRDDVFVALQALQALATETYAPNRFLEILAKEEEHLRLTYKRNQRAAANAARQRARKLNG